MWFEMRKENLSFLERAPVVHVAEAEVPAARVVVFTALVEPASWKDWFPNVRDVSYATQAPHGVGTVREANFSGTHWIEEMIAWDEPARWAWTVTRASVPFAKAQVESFELTDVAGGTRVRRAPAPEPRPLARGGAALAAPPIPPPLPRAVGKPGASLYRVPARALPHGRRR